MRVKSIETWPEGAERETLRSQWSSLLSEIDGASVFQTFEWNETWWRTFGKGHELRLLMVYSGENLVGIAPLMILKERRWGIPARRLMLIGTSNNSSDYGDFIVRRDYPSARKAILGWASTHARQWTVLELRNVPAASATVSLVSSNGILPRAIVRQSAVAPTRLLGNAVEDQKALNKKSLKRHFNGFQREGKLEYVRLSGAGAEARAEEFFDAFFDQHVRRWNGTGYPSLFLDPAQRAFYRAVSASLGAAGYLHFAVVLFDGRPLAFHFGFEFRGVFTWYKPTYEPEFARRSPGEVLIRFLLEDAVTRGLKEFDFTVGSEDFKFRFANEIRSVYRARVYRRAWERLPVAAYEWAKATIKRLRISAPSAEGTRQAHSA